MGGGSKTGLVLSGGGARGAYEAGVIRYLREELPERVQKNAHFDIFCGASIGAINCCVLASYSHQPEVQGRAICELWSQIRLDKVYHVGFRELLNLPKFLLGSKGQGDLDDWIGPARLGGLFNTSPLEQLARTGVKWRNIGLNIATDKLKALAINATHLDSGQTHVFVQQKEATLPAWSSDPQVKAFPVEIGPNHALASAAIPWIFPAVEVGGHIYSDGGLKLNTPISPALRLGADKLFVVGLRSHDAVDNEPSVVDHYPSAAYLLGKILNGLMLEKTDYELIRMERFNALLKHGTKRFGTSFSEVLAELMTSERGASYRPVETMVVRPSRSISKIATKHLLSKELAERSHGLIRPFLRRIAELEEGEVSDLFSYLLFDGLFAEELIALGMHDADAMRKEIIEFFS